MLLTEKSVLVVEDEFLIAMLLQDMLWELGCSRVTISTSVASAVEALQSGAPEFALLDLGLNGESSLAVAEILDKKGIPFVFSTGYRESSLPAKWKNRPVITKPFTSDDVVSKISQAVG